MSHNAATGDNAYARLITSGLESAFPTGECVQHIRVGLGPKAHATSMPGLEILAAALGITDIGLRSISLLYKSIKDLKSAPKVIAGLRNEVATLQKCLSGLQELLETADERIHAEVKRFGLPETAKSCADACSSLYKDISKWVTTQKLSVWARIHFLIQRRDLMAAIQDISNAKETTTLTAVMTNLAIQVSNSTPDSENRTATRDAEAAIAGLSSNGQQHGDEVISNALEEAKKELDRIKQNWQGKVTNEGHDNQLGILTGETGHSGTVEQNWDKDVNTKGDNNDVGYSGETGSVTQQWKEIVRSEGNNNKVGINVRRR